MEICPRCKQPVHWDAQHCHMDIDKDKNTQRIWYECDEQSPQGHAPLSNGNSTEQEDVEKANLKGEVGGQQGD